MKKIHFFISLIINLINSSSLYVFLILLPFSILHASEVDSLKAKQVGLNYFTPKIKAYQKNQNLPLVTPSLKLVYTATSDNKPIYYVFNLVNQKGFIILSAEESVQPILGYSYETVFIPEEKKPDAFTYILSGFSEQINYSRKNNLRTNSTTKGLWDKYSTTLTKSANETMATEASTAVAPLLATKWNQGCGYNADCPADAGGKCGKVWAGCVAVSQVQVMKYWNYPSSGTGTFSYTHVKYGVQTANFESATYNWGNMPNTSANAEIAKLLYHVGVSLSMNYGISGSGAYFSSIQHSLTKYYKYATNALCIFKSNYSETNWTNLIKRELNENRPVMYSGGTHAFVLDGFQNDSYFHFNWGWGGSYDGYFYLNSLNPGGSNFTSGQSAIVGAIPSGLYTGIDPAKITPLACAVAYNDSTTNGENRINRYKQNYQDLTGKEKVYSITTSITGQLKVRLSGLKGKNLNLCLLNYPHKDSLLQMGDTSLLYTNAKPGKYYIIVDGKFGDEGKYAITTICPTIQPDITITEAQVNPTYIEPNQPNVTLKCRVKNIGNSTASSNKLLFYYSVDKIINAGDIKIDSLQISSLNISDSVDITRIVTMPAITEGARYILFAVDNDNAVSETDETDNVFSSYFYAIPTGVMDCSSAVTLNSGEWYDNNTNINGQSLISNYLYYRKYTGKEIIHKLEATFNGLATVDFSENLTGTLSCFILPTCNENMVDVMLSAEAQNDTMRSVNVPVVKGKTYYFVVDGMNDLSGPYHLRVTMPDSCPQVSISIDGDSVRCKSAGNIYINGTYGHSNYQWYNDNLPVIDAKNSYYMASESGTYHVEVTENGCTTQSNQKIVLFIGNGKPTIVTIGSDSIQSTEIADTYEWYVNNNLTADTARTIKPAMSGAYKVIAITETCKSLSSDIFNFILTNTPAITGSNMRIYPNPSNGSFTLHRSNNQCEKLHIEVLTSTGTSVFQKDFSGNKSNDILIDLTKQPKGVYFVKITDNSGVKVEKIMIE